MKLYLKLDCATVSFAIIKNQRYLQLYRNIEKACPVKELYESNDISGSCLKHVSS